MLRAVQIYNDAMKTLVAVESVEFFHDKFANGSLVHGQIEPVAVVVSGSAGRFALDMAGKRTDIDALMQAVPTLASLLT